MNTYPNRASPNQASAKIYQFPARGRATGGGHRVETKSAVNLKSLRFVKVASGGAWYHEEAVEQDALARQN